jgi:CRISPR-associated protein Csd2
MTGAIKNRYEFVYLFDVENGNPNGDPDAGNMPRIDPETNHGLITDVCLKRKVRNYVQITKGDPKDIDSRYRIYVQEKAVLNRFHEEAYTAIQKTPKATEIAEPKGDEQKKKKSRKGSADEVEEARKWMCEHFFDVRTFGAVMGLGTNCGQVTGPVQINFARSIEPITPLEVTITRMAVATEEEARSQEGDNRTMGRKHIVPYGLYRAEGYISANFATKTVFSEEDLKLFWEALINMFDHDHSAARGKMNARTLIAFKHESAIGSAPAHKLLDLVKVARSSDKKSPARSFADYSVTVGKGDVPSGVELLELL